MTYDVGTDTGGTFTDLVMLDDVGNVIRVKATAKSDIIDNRPNHSAIVDIGFAVWEEA